MLCNVVCTSYIDIDFGDFFWFLIWGSGCKQLGPSDTGWADPHQCAGDGGGSLRQWSLGIYVWSKHENNKYILTYQREVLMMSTSKNSVSCWAALISFASFTCWLTTWDFQSCRLLRGWTPCIRAAFAELQAMSEDNKQQREQRTKVGICSLLVWLAVGKMWKLHPALGLSNQLPQAGKTCSTYTKWSKCIALVFVWSILVHLRQALKVQARDYLMRHSIEDPWTRWYARSKSQNRLFLIWTSQM